MHELLVYLQSHLTVTQIIEIIVLTFLFFELLDWIKDTQAEQVVKGLIVLLILMPICNWIGFTTLSYLIRSMFTWIFLFIIIVFQPELRSALEQLGSNTFSTGNLFQNSQVIKTEKTVNTLVETVDMLVRSKTGALILCELNTGLRDIANTGTIIDGEISTTLIMNLFFNKAPLHDGAIILNIKTDKVVAAGCVLPLTGKKNLPHFFGTRHRAGIGVSEQSDAFIIIVSEETGKVTIAQNGNYEYNVSDEVLKERLLELYVAPLQNKKSFSFPGFSSKETEKE